MALTSSQQKAVEARGNVLVMAGAGTGKTRALVERCLHCLLHERPRASVDELLVVTFTEAAATEIRQRVRGALLEQTVNQPFESRWHEELALFETAHIGTLHSFCLKLIKEHFCELELDPQLAVIPEEDTRLLADQIMERMFQRHYEGTAQECIQVRDLIKRLGKGSDEPLRQTLWRLHNYTQTLPNPAKWYDTQSAVFSNPQPELWRRWFSEEVVRWRRRAGTLLGNRGLGPSAGLDDFQFLREFAQSFCEDGAKRKNGLPKGLVPLIEEAAFLHSLHPTGPGPDPMEQDWEWVRGPVATLLRLGVEFSRLFAAHKRELGVVDFHDLEQHALNLLWDVQGQPTPIANKWRERFRFVFVDEYQDINTAQDRILAGLSRGGSQANRFLVGDVKQSIYRFRLANPKIFQDYSALWRSGEGSTIALRENFRSRAALLQFINAVFDKTMRRELGGVDYDAEARLAFGTAGPREDLPQSAPESVELHLRLRCRPEGENGGTDGSASPIAELEEAAKEARLCALRLRQLRVEKFPIWDEKLGCFRPVDWGDMAVLLRAPSGKSESFAKEFSRLGIPLQVERRGFYSSAEISDLLSLLQLLDNPLQDVPTLAVMRSPFVGLSLEELSVVRLARVKAPFWVALNQWKQTYKEGRDGSRSDSGDAPEVDSATLFRKVSQFLRKFGRWRRLSRQVSLSECLETILDETDYLCWLQLQSRGTQRRANVQQLLSMARRFDQMQRQGLYRFLRHVEAQQEFEAEPDVGGAPAANAVRLLSIHQSKGLEFPVVLVADLSKPFNLSDLRAGVILDAEYGVCPQVTPPGRANRFPSLAHWLAARKQKHESLGEELRLLYVAMTRARDLLLLVCSLSENRYAARWLNHDEVDVASASSCADWLALALRDVRPELNNGAMQDTATVNGPTGACPILWFEHRDVDIAGAAENGSNYVVVAPPDQAVELPEPGGMLDKLSWCYGHQAAIIEPAKTTVSSLRRRVSAIVEEVTAPSSFEGREQRARHGASTAAEIGIAHHLFMQHVALECTGSAEALTAQVEQLLERGALTAAQARMLDVDSIRNFWVSRLGAAVRKHGQWVHRELPFTFRVSLAEMAALTTDSGTQAAGGSYNPAQSDAAAEEFVIVQGVADLVVLLPREVWLVDFKTEHLGNDERSSFAKYAPQLRLYARALKLIYGRPVTQSWLWFLLSSRGLEVPPHDYWRPGELFW